MVYSHELIEKSRKCHNAVQQRLQTRIVAALMRDVLYHLGC